MGSPPSSIYLAENRRRDGGKCSKESIVIKDCHIGEWYAESEPTQACDSCKYDILHLCVSCWMKISRLRRTGRTRVNTYCPHEGLSTGFQGCAHTNPETLRIVPVETIEFNHPEVQRVLMFIGEGDRPLNHGVNANQSEGPRKWRVFVNDRGGDDIRFDPPRT